MRMLKNVGVAITLTSSSRSSASPRQSSWLPRIRWPSVGGASAMGVLLRTGLARDDLQDVADADVVVGPLVDLAAVAHHHEPVAEAQDLLELGGDEDDRHPLPGQV